MRDYPGLYGHDRFDHAWTKGQRGTPQAGKCTYVTGEAFIDIGQAIGNLPASIEQCFTHAKMQLPCISFRPIPIMTLSNSVGIIARRMLIVMLKGVSILIKPGFTVQLCHLNIASRTTFWEILRSEDC